MRWQWVYNMIGVNLQIFFSEKIQSGGGNVLTNDPRVKIVKNVPEIYVILLNMVKYRKIFKDKNYDLSSIKK